MLDDSSNYERLCRVAKMRGFSVSVDLVPTPLYPAKLTLTGGQVRSEAIGQSVNEASVKLLYWLNGFYYGAKYS